MEKSWSFLQSPTYNNVITVLSIDGGGIRGVIFGTILSCLEAELQVQNNVSCIYVNKFIITITILSISMHA